MPKTYTISQLAKCFKLSRSTLLYYHRKKIFQPSIRGDNNYRFYSEEDYQVLKKICTLRQIGIPLKQIVSVIKHKDTVMTEILNIRLMAINDEIHQLRNHQRLIISILGNTKLLNNTRAMNKESWVKLLKAAGLNEAGMTKWHQEFEQYAPHAHQDFLESLGLTTAEVNAIRKKSRS